MSYFGIRAKRRSAGMDSPSASRSPTNNLGFVALSELEEVVIVGEVAYHNVP